MHEDDPVKGEGGKELAPGPLSSRRSALFRILAGSGAAYAVPLAASFSMGGLSLPAPAAAAPVFGNQCYLGNQPFPYMPSYYRIGVRAKYTLNGIRSRGAVAAYFLVQIQSISLVDDTGWTASVDVWFGVDDSAPIFLGYGLTSKGFGGDFTLVVSNKSGRFSLLFPESFNGVRGGGPLVFTRDRIRELTSESLFPSRPINGVGVVFGADASAWTECGLLRIHDVRPNASISTAGGGVSSVPSGALPPATVPSGEL
jgi:hypothetical protein